MNGRTPAAGDAHDIAFEAPVVAPDRYSVLRERAHFDRLDHVAERAGHDTFRNELDSKTLRKTGRIASGTSVAGVHHRDDLRTGIP